MPARIRTLAATAMLLIALPPVAATQETMELTALDYIEIQQLVAKYAVAIDTCSNNGYDYADLYTADGVFQPSVPGMDVSPIRGREALAEVSGGGSNNCENVPWIDQGIRHVYTNHIIMPAPDGAVGRVDMLMIGLDGDPYRIAHDGYYDDIYVKTEDGWRFAKRTHHALLIAGQPIDADAVEAGD